MKKKKTIGLAHGVFDVLHSGHLLHFEECKKHCDKLIVSITEDKYVNKGPGRPFFSSLERLRLLKSISFVDQVLINKDYTPIKLIRKLKPDYYFKGKDYKNFSEDLTGNIIRESNEVKKNGGKILITNTKLKSSSSIINKNLNILDREIKMLLRKIDKDKLKNFFQRKPRRYNNKNILIFGEPIIDKYSFVESLGKSQKNQIISTKFIANKIYGGGSLLISIYLAKFFPKINYICIKNNFNDKYYKKFLNPNIKKIFIKDNQSKVTIKNRYVNEYRKERLFQVNENDNQTLSPAGNKKLIEFLKKNIKKYYKIFIFDFGHGLISKDILKIVNKNKTKFLINCQSNSSNFGFNLASKYTGGDTICMDEMEFRLCVTDNKNSILELIKNNQHFIKKFKNFIITMGKKGCYYINNKKIFFIPSIYKSIKDTTGSGDIFFSTLGFLSATSDLGIYEKTLLSHIAGGVHAMSEGNSNSIDLAVISKIYFNLIK